MKITIKVLLVGLGFTAAIALGQSGPPAPGPEHAKLDTFAGSWTLEGAMKAGPSSPESKFTESQKCEWMLGNFYVVCHTDYKSGMGDGSAVSYMGYSDEDKAYTYREFNSSGEFEESRGSVDGDTWTWTSDEKMGGKLIKSRFTMKLTSPTSYNFTFEMSRDGTSWNTVMDGKAIKMK